jgi:polyisoprenoid-binding protein YceI
MRLLFALLILLPQMAFAAAWSIVPGDTRVAVDVPWMGNVVTMRFDTVRGVVEFDRRHPERAKAEISVATGDVETGLGIVNAFVKSRGYLNAKAYPEIRFRLERLEQTSKSTADVFGQITIFGVTKPIGLKAEVFRYGPSPDAEGRFDAGFNLSGAVDRREFGNTTGYPEVAAVLPVRIHLLMRSDDAP